MLNGTRKLYPINSYIRKFSAQVLDCRPVKDRFEIILDQTAFYPEGGGQPADQGVLAGQPVLDVREADGEVVHVTGAPLPVGSQVEGEIDWPLRFDRMQHHTGEHIVSGLVNRLFGFDNVGFHMGSDGVTIDFSGTLSEEMLDQVEWLANEAVFRNDPIEAAYPDPAALAVMTYRSKKALAGDVRIVVIPGIDRCACCGTHTRSTGEVGIVKLLKPEKYKGGTRVTMLSGFKALLDYRDKTRNTNAISVCLSSRPSEVREAVDKVMQEMMFAKRKVTELKWQIWELRAAQIETGCGRAVVFADDLSPDDLRQYCQILIRKAKLAVVFSPAGAPDFKYAIRSDDMDVRPLAAALNKRFNGRGGGKSSFCQGAVQGLREEIEAFINDIGQG